MTEILLYDLEIELNRILDAVDFEGIGPISAFQEVLCAFLLGDLELAVCQMVLQGQLWLQIELALRSRMSLSLSLVI